MRGACTASAEQACVFRRAVISIDLLKPQDAMLLKELRFSVLLESPSAFSSTYEKDPAEATEMGRTGLRSGRRSATISPGMRMSLRHRRRLSRCE